MDNSEKANQLPGWFDAKKHKHTNAGVIEVDTGLWLAGDGLPLSGPIRARRLAEAGKTTDALDFVSAAAIALQADGLAEEARLAANELAASAAGTEERRLARLEADAAKKAAKAGTTQGSAIAAAGTEEARLAANEPAASAAGTEGDV